jgi:hypothetical protein
LKTVFLLVKKMGQNLSTETLTEEQILELEKGTTCNLNQLKSQFLLLKSNVYSTDSKKLI